MGAWVGSAVKDLQVDPNSRWFWNLLGFPVGLFLALRSWMVTWTSRVEITGEGATHTGPAIYVNWHRHLPYLIAHHGAHRRWMMVREAPYMAPIAAWCR